MQIRVFFCFREVSVLLLQKHLTSLSQNPHIALCHLDHQGRILFFDSHGLRKKGLHPDTIRGAHWTDIFMIPGNSSGEKKDIPLLFYASLTEKAGGAEFLWVTIKKDSEGSICLGLEVPAFESQGGFLDILGEEEVQIILGHVQDLVLYLSPTHQILWANEACVKAFGRSLEELKEMFCHELWQEQKEACHVCSLYQTLERSASADYRVVTPDGRHWNLQGYPVYNEDGTIRGVLQLATDCTSLLEAQEEGGQYRQKIKGLHEIALEMSRLHQEEDVSRFMVESAESILEFHYSTMDVVQGDELIVKATSSGLPEGESRNMSIHEGLAGKTYRQQQPIIISDLFEETGVPSQGTPYRSLLSVPVSDLGVFQVVSENEGAFSGEDVELAEILASHAAEALRRIRHQEQIRYMTFYDTLTGVYNRAYFEEELQRLNQERQLPLTIIIADVNGLKLVNDAFGHEAGNSLLQRLAKNMSKSCREEDLVCRWGGDEFAILLPQTSESVGMDICLRIRQACKEANGFPIPLSVALGVASKVNMKQDTNKVLQDAEEAMYRNKLLEGSSYRSSFLNFMAQSLFEKSNETEEHAHRLQEMALIIGRELNLSTVEMDELILLAALHDIGKIAIPEEIIKKPGPLGTSEWEEVKRHPEIGCRIAESTAELSPIARGILSHHERWDGKGYPQGLKGETIPLIARIIAIVDAYDVMRNGRPYKEAMAREEAVAELRRCAGTQFDPNLVDILVEYIEKME